MQQKNIYNYNLFHDKKVKKINSNICAFRLRKHDACEEKPQVVTAWSEQKAEKSYKALGGKVKKAEGVDQTNKKQQHLPSLNFSLVKLSEKGGKPKIYKREICTSVLITTVRLDAVYCVAGISRPEIVNPRNWKQGKGTKKRVTTNEDAVERPFFKLRIVEEKIAHVLQQLGQ